jgi:hypothetical protein
MSQPPSGERRKFVFVFTGTPSADGASSVDVMIGFAKKVLGWQVEATMDLRLTTKVKIDTVEDPQTE